MKQLLSLYSELQKAGVRFYTWDMNCSDAVTIEMDGQYNVFMDFDQIRTLAEEKVNVAHEGGHALTGATHKVRSPVDLIERHEYKANKWAIKKLLPKDELWAAIRHGYTEPWQLADYFNVTEPFICQAIQYYDHCGDVCGSSCTPDCGGDPQPDAD